MGYYGKGEQKMAEHGNEFIRLMGASHLALGFIIGKEGTEHPIAIELATALFDNGSDSTYVMAIVKNTITTSKDH